MGGFGLQLRNKDCILERKKQIIIYEFSPAHKSQAHAGFHLGYMGIYNIHLPVSAHSVDQMGH